jgi:outer membrane protein assembly factor BamB
MRSGKVAWKVVGTVVLAILTLAQGYLYGVLRLDFSGEGMIPSFRLASQESHYERIEKSREEQKKQAPPEVPPVVNAAAPAEAAAATPAANAATEAKSVEAKPAAETKETAPVSRGGSWPDFRGPNRDGISTEPILTQWPAGGLKQAWRIPVGGGYASMTVFNGRVVTIEQRRAQEVVAAYDLASGRELWTNGWNAEFKETLGGDGPRATPIWHNGRVYALGAMGELRAIDGGTGKTIWSKNILKDAGAENIQWGMSAAPLIVDNTVVVLPGGSNGKSVVAYDKNTGAMVWSSLDDKAAYASPRLVTLGGVRQIVLMTAKRTVGITANGGKLLWEYPWQTDFDINAAEPAVVGENRVVVSSGYGRGAVLLELTKNGETMTAKPVWENKNLKAKFNSPVLFEGHLYGLDEGILACVQASSGERRWKGGRYGFGQVILASGHVIAITEQGEVVLVKATPESHQEVAKFKALDGKTWNHPAIASGKLLVRNTTEMVAYQIAP